MTTIDFLQSAGMLIIAVIVFLVMYGLAGLYRRVKAVETNRPGTVTGNVLFSADSRRVAEKEYVEHVGGGGYVWKLYLLDGLKKTYVAHADTDFEAEYFILKGSV